MRTLLVALLFPLTVVAQSPTWEWASQTGDNGHDYGEAVAVSPAGDVYVVGRDYVSSLVLEEVLVERYTVGGALVWARRYGGPSYDAGTGVAVGTEGDVFVSGSFLGTATFGSLTLTSAGNADAFVARLTPEGSVVWVQQFGGTGQDHAHALAADGSGGVIVTGEFSGTSTFGGWTLTSAGSTDAFALQLTADGSVSWVRPIGGDGGAAIGAAVAVGADGTAVVAGRFEGTVAAGSTAMTSAGSLDAFASAFGADGSPAWATSMGGPGMDRAEGVAVDASGQVVVVGAFQGSAAFGPFGATSSGGDDVFVARLGPEGAVARVDQAGGSQNDVAWGVAAASDGVATVTGSFAAPAAFGDVLLTNGGAFVARYASGGGVVWAERAGASMAGGIALATPEAALVVGDFAYTADFGPFVLTAVNVDFRDIFVARIAGQTVSVAGTPTSRPSLTLSLPAPHPTRSRTTVTITVPRPQHIRVEVVDALGRAVAAMFEGAIRPSQPVDLSVEVAALSAGAYWLRAVGEDETVVVPLQVVR